MEIAPHIFTAKVMHHRLFPRKNRFSYRVYYLAMPLPAQKLPSVVQSFPYADLGFRDGTCPRVWAQEILQRHGLLPHVSNIVLLAMPRVLGYVFNPVSFYLCMDESNQLRAVISEVHNTFGEQHSYLCARADLAPISPEEWLEAEKLFHVSPFLERSGYYRFRFNIQTDAIGIWIDHYDRHNNKQLVTALSGRLKPLTRGALAAAFWAHPMVTLKAVALIHWQALKLVAKGIRYIPKPRQLAVKLSASGDLTKM
jgi:DUF1365 family protein